jgi:V-type H+-transporting ATPase subunit a
VQAVVDSYGIPRYQEINPGMLCSSLSALSVSPLSLSYLHHPVAVITAATFPFLFAIMFGDVGHGLLLVLGAVIAIVMHRMRPHLFHRNEVLGMVGSARYLLLVMGASER